jgi:hypothetical protein
MKSDIDNRLLLVKKSFLAVASEFIFFEQPKFFEEKHFKFIKFKKKPTPGYGPAVTKPFKKVVENWP